jgi:hypothetical protein
MKIGVAAESARAPLKKSPGYKGEWNRGESDIRFHQPDMARLGREADRRKGLRLLFEIETIQKSSIAGQRER